MDVTKHCQKVMGVTKYDQVLWNQQNIGNIMETTNYRQKIIVANTNNG